jgi:hypothetical protein
LHFTKCEYYHTVWVLSLMPVVPPIEKYRSGGSILEAAGGLVCRVEGVKTLLISLAGGTGLSSQVCRRHK